MSDGALILYTVLVGSALELGENVRFKFMIEPLLLKVLDSGGGAVADRWRLPLRLPILFGPTHFSRA